MARTGGESNGVIEFSLDDALTLQRLSIAAQNALDARDQFLNAIVEKYGDGKSHYNLTVNRGCMVLAENEDGEPDQDLD